MSGMLRLFLCWLGEHAKVEVVSRSDFGGPPDPDEDPVFWLAPENFQTVRCASCGRVFEMHWRDVPNEARKAAANSLDPNEQAARTETEEGSREAY
jgi:hypothetical protein